MCFRLKDPSPPEIRPLTVYFYISENRECSYPRSFSLSSCSGRVGAKSGPSRGTPLGPVLLRRPGLALDQSEAELLGPDQ